MSYYRKTPHDEATILFDYMTTWLVRLELQEGETIEIFLERIRMSDLSGPVKDLLTALTLKAAADELTED